MKKITIKTIKEMIKSFEYKLLTEKYCYYEAIAIQNELADNTLYLESRGYKGSELWQKNDAIKQKINAIIDKYLDAKFGEIPTSIG